MTQTVSIITTVYNEEESIIPFLDSLNRQTKIPNEVIIVDATSKDKTLELIENYKKQHPNFPLKIYIKPGNRSVGRNEAIKRSSSTIIAATDAGCYVSPTWLENITKPFTNTTIDVVGGWYEPIVKTTWDYALAKTFNFSSKKINPNTFLPSTRSIAFKKTAWEKAGGFDECLSHNEDTPFAIRLHTIGAHFAFADTAIVNWAIASNTHDLYRTIFRYALGDGQSSVYSFHYFMLFSFSLVLLISFTLGFFAFQAWIIGLLLLVGYLYLPLLQSLGIKNVKELYLIPLQKATIILANIFGFIKGLCTKI